MPLCAVCDTRYYRGGYEGPPEPCDCGNNYDYIYIETEDDVQEVSELREAWLNNDHDDDGA